MNIGNLGVNTSSSSHNIDMDRAPGSNIRTACDSCRARKTKCSAEKPACAYCVKANRECTYSKPPQRGEPNRSGYVASLEARIKELVGADSSRQSMERQIERSNEPIQHRYRSPEPLVSPHRRKRRRHTDRRGSQTDARSGSDLESNHNSASIARSSSRSPDRSRRSSPTGFQDLHPTLPEPVRHSSPRLSRGQSNRSYLPSNSQLVDRLPAAKELGTVYRVHPLGYSPHQQSADPTTTRQHETVTEGSVSNTAAVGPTSNLLPSLDERRILLDRILEHTNTAFPILHGPTLQRDLESIYHREQGTPPTDYATCLLFLVSAVSASSLPKDVIGYREIRDKSTAWWRLAQKVMCSRTTSCREIGVLKRAADRSQHLPAMLVRSDYTRLQFRLLQLHYVLLNPDAGDVWELVGTAMRTAVDLGLHHELAQGGWREKDDPLAVDMGRRLFWSTYAIERNLAIALGRPTTVPDNWINAEASRRIHRPKSTLNELTCAYEHFMLVTQYPSLMPDSAITSRGIEAGMPSSDKLAAVHQHFAVRRIQSEIHQCLYSSVGPYPTDPEWQRTMLDRVQAWRTMATTTTTFMSQLWLDLNYHMTIMNLCRPSPGNQNPDRYTTKRAIQSSSEIMKIYRAMFRQKMINFNWLAMYHLFMSGVTYLGSLWQAHKQGWTIVPTLIDALLDIQGCSATMEGLAATTPGTNGIRNALENVSEGVLRHLSSNSRAIGASRPISPVAHRPHIMQGASLDLSIGATMNPTTGQPVMQMPLEPNFIIEPGLFAPHQEDVIPVTYLNPLDGFLFHPLGDMSELEWNEAVEGILQQMHREDPTMLVAQR